MAPPTNLREQLQSTLGSAYLVERELGGGGMARVFVAQETALGRPVVVKVLPPEMSGVTSVERFRQEVRLAARLNHPHLVPLLAAGEAGGVLYYTMPFAAGESLRARLVREGKLPIHDAVAILHDIAAALACAHAHGIVHRDLKPENVLLTGGEALVCDFGVAKALDAARMPDEAEPHALTSRSMVLGTPAYMAPEQAAADPHVDARADLYALGCVAYELLTGAPPFPHRSPQQTLAAQIVEAPEPLSNHRPGVPPTLGALVMRLLEKLPPDRPQSAEEVLRALDAVTLSSHKTLQAGSRQPSGTRISRARLAVAVAALALSIGAVVIVRGRAGDASPASAPARLPARPVLAVLPFENLGPATDDYFADGLTDEVTTRLASLSGLGVIGRASARQFEGSGKSPRAIAAELGATHLLTGTVRWERAPDGTSRVRVSPQLVRAADQTTLWGEPYEGPLGDVFRVQAEVAERVAGALDVALLSAERRVLSAPPTTNLAAYDAYLRGLANATRPKESDAQARRAAVADFERAVALDSTFTAAYARLAVAYLTQLRFVPDPAFEEKAQAAAERAEALDSGRPEVRRAMARYLLTRGDPNGALAVLGPAPQDAEGLSLLGASMISLRRLDEALAALSRAELLDPRAAEPPENLAELLGDLGRYEEAIRSWDRALAVAPDNLDAYVSQAATYLLWRADTAAGRRVMARAVAALGVWRVTRSPYSVQVGPHLWVRVLPAGVRSALDTISLAAFLAAGGNGPANFHWIKGVHFVGAGDMRRARAHFDSLIAVYEPAVAGDTVLTLSSAYNRPMVLARAYAYVGRAADAARVTDREVARARAKGDSRGLAVVLRRAAQTDVIAGRHDVAVARLAELLRLPSGWSVSQVLLRADDQWDPLRGRSDFERLVAHAR